MSVTSSGHVRGVGALECSSTLNRPTAVLRSPCALRCCACAGAPKGVVVAYLLEEGGKHYSCLLENADSGVDERTHKPAPRFKIQLPGPPVLGDGKGDNQNCAIIFSRGTIRWLDLTMSAPSQCSTGRLWTN